jgi:hypothetical protein
MLDRPGGHDCHSGDPGHLRQALLSSETQKLCILLISGQPGRSGTALLHYQAPAAD